MTVVDTPALVPLEAIQRAADRIRAVVRRTPLLPATSDVRRAGLWLKCENFQVAGAFKIRGAANMVRQLGRRRAAPRRHHLFVGQPRTGAGLRSGTARRAGGRRHAHNRARREGRRARAGTAPEVIFAGTTSAERKREAERIRGQRGLTMVPPFDHPWIIAGQGTSGLEILDELPDATRLRASRRRRTAVRRGRRDQGPRTPQRASLASSRRAPRR